MNIGLIVHRRSLSQRRGTSSQYGSDCARGGAQLRRGARSRESQNRQLQAPVGTRDRLIAPRFSPSDPEASWNRSKADCLTMLERLINSRLARTRETRFVNT